MFDVRQLIPVGAPGTGIRSWNLPGSFQIAGITIDNPCGSWLFIPQDHTFIPPYTLGFAHSFAPTLSRIDILFANGPAGQISTQLGDVPTVYIFDTPVAESAGVASSGGQGFILQFTPVLLAINTTFDIGLVTVTQNLIPAIATNRVRVLTLSAQNSLDSVDHHGMSPVRYTLEAPGIGAFFLGELHSEKLAHQDIWPNGLDFPFGGAVDLAMTSDWSNNRVFIRCTFQRI